MFHLSTGRFKFVNKRIGNIQNIFLTKILKKMLFISCAKKALKRSPPNPFEPLIESQKKKKNGKSLGEEEEKLYFWLQSCGANSNKIPK
jgi:hypothetical protein